MIFSLMPNRSNRCNHLCQENIQELHYSDFFPGINYFTLMVVGLCLISSLQSQNEASFFLFFEAKQGQRNH